MYALYLTQARRLVNLDDAQMLQLIKKLPTENYKASKDLANDFQVTSRTIRSYLNDLKTIVQANGAVIETKPYYGIRLIIEDKQKFHQFLELTEEQLKEFPNSQDERVQYLMEYLLIERENFVTIENLCEQLFVSRRTLSNDLSIVKEKLSKYNLFLESKPKYGIKVTGEEFDLRLCIANNSSNTLLKKLGYVEETSGHKQIEKISKILNKVFNGMDFSISGNAYQNLVSHLFVALHRMQDTCADNIMSKERVETIKNDFPFEYKVANEITKDLSVEFNVDIPEEEIAYITIHLAGKEMLDITKQNESNIVISDESNQMVKNMLELIYEFFNIDFRDDLELRVSLALHLIPLKVRLFYDMDLDNPMLKEIKTRFTLAYTIAVQACSILQKKFNKVISENEIGYIALHFNLALERKGTKEDLKNVLIVCSSGRGTAELLFYRFKSEFGEYLNKIKTIDLYQLKDIDFSSYDYIITTVPIPFSVPIPILEISYFLEGEDIKEIKALFSGHSSEKLSNFFNKDLFFTDLEFNTKEEVLEYMVHEIRKTKSLPDEYLSSVMKREKQASTEFGNLVALPHPERTMTDETFVTVAILNKPIIWNERKVQLVYLMSIENNENRDLQELYKVTSRTLRNKQHVESIIKRQDFDFFLDIIQQVWKEVT